jgi:hypothetical protein
MTARKPRPTCPICHRPLGEGPEAARFRPFCSRRCADVDLHRWLSGAYRVETDEAPGDGRDREDER